MAAYRAHLKLKADGASVARAVRHNTDPGGGGLGGGGGGVSVSAGSGAAAAISLARQGDVVGAGGKAGPGAFFWGDK
jgi:hypothetical protein